MMEFILVIITVILVVWLLSTLYGAFIAVDRFADKKPLFQLFPRYFLHFLVVYLILLVWYLSMNAPSAERSAKSDRKSVV